MKKKEADLSTLQGRLMKRDRTFHNWKTRNFYLKQGRLQYFNDKGTMKGDLNLHQEVPVLIRLSSTPKTFGFTLILQDDKLHLGAESEQVRRSWIEGIMSQCDAIVDQEFVSLSTDKVGKKKFNAALIAPSSNDKTMESGPMREQYSRITFPASLSNGDMLSGIGPIVRRIGFTDERLLAVALYIDPAEALQELNKFSDHSIEDLYGNQKFYDSLIEGKFRKTFVISCRKRISRSILLAFLSEEIGTRMNSDEITMEELQGFVDKSLKKGESMVLICNPEGIFEFRYRGVVYPPISSPEICAAIQGMFFDLNSIQHDSKRSLVSRIPSLWGDTNSHFVHSESEEGEALGGSDGDDDEHEEQEEERLRRESFNFTFKFGPLVDTETDYSFDEILDNGTVLVGIWRYMEKNQLNNGNCNYVVGLYVFPAGASECLLRYKGLSSGSMLSDPQFHTRFMGAQFAKTVVFRMPQEDSISLFGEKICADIMQCTNALSDDIVKLKEFIESSKDSKIKGGTVFFTINLNGTLRVSISTLVGETKEFSRACALAFQSTFYGYHPIDSEAPHFLFQRFPAILDQARDDLVHTYHDEIKMLKENYLRQQPGTRLKVGYLQVLHENSRGAMRWNKRWCRLDGIAFSYFGHKRKRKPRRVLTLSQCIIEEISQKDDKYLDLRSQSLPHMTIRIACPGSTDVILYTDSIFEGSEWLDALVDASKYSKEAIKEPKSTEEKQESHTEYDYNKYDSEKYGSLLRWIMEDPRNALIMVLITLIVWLVSNSESLITLPLNR